MKIGNRIKGLRIENDMSIELMADRLGISPQTYRKLESDKTSPDLKQLELIASAFNKSILDLLPETILFNNNDQKGGIALAYQSTINQQSEKLIEQYEKRIAEKDALISDLKALLSEYKSQLFK
ncbi:MAG: helix-turn-helix transcriptional regulator [Flavobacterium sp.]|jgi:transcriptional regulator with XRE-family HTH domain|nr:helix-turn-helix transcriptional regulator [Flavobacterium sp.]